MQTLHKVNDQMLRNKIMATCHVLCEGVVSSWPAFINLSLNTIQILQPEHCRARCHCLL